MLARARFYLHPRQIRARVDIEIKSANVHMFNYVRLIAQFILAYALIRIFIFIIIVNYKHSTTAEKIKLLYFKGGEIKVN